jgi:hypothetical protein
MAAKTPLQQHHAVNRDSLEPSDFALAMMDKTLYVKSWPAAMRLNSQLSTLNSKL